MRHGDRSASLNGEYMDWQKGETSDNVEVDSGGGGPRFGGGRGMSLGGILIMAILGWIFFKNPLALLDQSGGQSAGSVAPTGQPIQVDPQQKLFVQKILGSTEKTWSDIFAANGKTYVDPKLELFSGGVNTACGAASTAVGPFYCPGDQKVYLDLDFFKELQDRFHASGDFARAYVIAHEVGHHVQKLTGGSTRWMRRGARACRWTAPMVCRCGRNCRRIATRACGPTAPSSACNGCSRVTWNRRSTPRARSVTIRCSRKRRAASCPTRSPMGRRRNG